MSRDNLSVQFSSVQSLSHIWLFVTSWTAPHQSSLSITNSNSCPSSRWCHPTILSSVVPFSSYPQSFPASGSFPMNHIFSSSGQSIGFSASAPVLPMNIQGWFPLGLTDLISFLPKGLSRVPWHSQGVSPQFKDINYLVLRLLYCPALTSINDYWKNHSFDYTNICR